MKTLTLIAALTLSLNAMANTPKKAKSAPKGDEKYQLDTAASNATWIGKKLAGTHTGKISFKVDLMRS